MSWTTVLAANDLASGTRQVVTIGKRKILLLNHDGQIYAVDNACPHLKLPMKGGKIEGGAIVCPWHRSAFDLQTGAAQKWIAWPPGVNKALALVSTEKSLPVFPTRIEDGSIQVNLPVE